MQTILALALLLFASASAIAAETKEPSRRLAGYLSQSLQLSARSSYKLAEADLNGDGRPEAIVYVTDSSFCGSGGCTLFVLSPTATTYRVVLRSTVARLPIRLLSSSTHGWRDIGVTVSGGGIPHPYEARLRFSGHRYPSNPTVVPSVPLGQSTGRILLEE